MDNYSKLLIKDYSFWSVFVHENQGYLGRCVIWCQRTNALDLTDATKKEQEELFLILRDLKNATKKAFNADWFNYAFLGNETRHLHGHFVPRYTSPRHIEGVTFIDERWGRNYQTDKNFVTPPLVLEEIKLIMMVQLEQL